MGTRGEKGSYGSFYPLLGVFEGRSMYFLKVWAKSAVTAVSPPHGFSRPFRAFKPAQKLPENCRRNCRNMRARPQEVALSTDIPADCQGVNATYARRKTIFSARADVLVVITSTGRTLMPDEVPRRTSCSVGKTCISHIEEEVRC
jgi:hypothetical protein